MSASPLPPWTWRIPAAFNAAAACVDGHLGTDAATRPAVICHDDAHGVAQLTFAELATRTSQFAQLLRDLGVGAGDRVLVRLPNCLEYSVVFLGAMKRGAVPVPTSIQLTADEVLFLARDAGAVALATTRASWNALHVELERLDGLRDVFLTGDGDAVAATRVRLHDLDDALAAITHWDPPHPTRADDPAYLVYTSGTTDYPKGVLHAHRSLLGRQPASEYWFSFAPGGGDRVLHAGKYNWTYVLGTGLMDPLYRGQTTIVYEGALAPHVWPRLIAEHGATIFIAVPTVYRQIVQKTAYGHADVPTLRHCMCAGESLSGEVLAAWRDRFRQDIYEGLGMTECSYYISQPRGWPIRPGSAGFPQPGHDVRLLDPATMTPVPTGAEGMLCIPRSDPALLLRYWNREAEMARCVPRRLVPHRRLRAPRRRRLPLVPRPARRSDQHVRLPRVAVRGGAGDQGSSRRRRLRRRRRGAGTRQDRRRRVRHPTTGERSHPRRRARLCGTAPRLVQGAARRVSGRRPAAHPQRQGAAPRAAAAGRA